MICIKLPEADVKTFLSEYGNLYRKPGFYFLRNRSGEIVYIGETGNILNRIREHFKGNATATKDFHKYFHTVDVHYCEAKDRKIYEIYAINLYNPPGNIWDNCNMSLNENRERKRKWIEEEWRKFSKFFDRWDKYPVRTPIKIQSDLN